MKITYNWLKEYIDVPWGWRELTERLTMAGLALEGAEDLGRGLEGVVVGHVLERAPHPNADRLSVCRVAVGGGAVRQVVCGAPNVAPQQKVAVVLAGGRLPDGRAVGEATIRGVASAGVICSEKELGLGEDGTGILVLAPDAPTGAPLAQVLGLDDVLLDFEVTPNRPDCLSVIGIAREVSALTGNPVRYPAVSVPEGGERVEEVAGVQIEDAEGCPRYAARVVMGVRVGPSPRWLRRRLESVGLRSINNVVDVTNFVLLEMGHPLHAFDLSRLAERRIVVRRALAGERIRTLDGVDRSLTPEVLVIADAARPVAVAGVMGGGGSEVTATTADVLIESAYFEPRRVRAGRRLLNLSTEASQRFERGADFDAPVRALDRAAALIVAVAGGTAAQGHLDVYPRPLTPPTVALRRRRVNEVLGTDLSDRTISRILTALGCLVAGGDGALKVTVPTCRPDLTREADLVEEVARLYGFDRIRSRGVRAWNVSVRRSPEERLRDRLRALLTGLGMTEVVTNTLIDEGWVSLCGLETSPVRVSNPVSAEAAALRPALLPSLLNVARWNLNRKVERICIFEIGKVFSRPALGGAEERVEVAGLLIGPRSVGFWEGERPEFDFFDAKGVLEGLFAHLSARPVSTPPFASAIYEPGPSAEVRLGEETVGTVGQVRRSVAGAFDIRRDAFAFVLDFQRLLSCVDERRTFSPLPRFPAVERDFALVVGEGVQAGGLQSLIREEGGTIVEAADVFDLYRGDKVPPRHKSVAFSLRFRAPDRTLSEGEVDEVCGRILRRLREVYGAELRKT